MVGPTYCLFHDGCYPGPGDFLFFRRDMAFNGERHQYGFMAVGF